MDQSVILVAGGKGLRMGEPVPKQFLKVKGMPILVHTVKNFLDYNPSMTIVIVLPQDHLPTWEEMQKTFLPQTEIQLVLGGATRFDSVRNGLDALPNDGLVAIHDGVRPLVSHGTIARSFKSAEKYGSGIAAVPLKETIRLIEGNHTLSVSRDDYRAVQTPQTFQTALIKEAFRKAKNNLFTDDASVFEAAGFPVHLVESSYQNIKVTTKDDLVVMERLVQETD